MLNIIFFLWVLTGETYKILLGGYRLQFECEYLPLNYASDHQVTCVINSQHYSLCKICCEVSASATFRFFLLSRENLKSKM